MDKIQTNTKQKIITQAMKHFLQTSYAEFSLNEMIRQSGLSKGGFYHYFNSKEELFSICIHELFEMLRYTDSISTNRMTVEEYISYYHFSSINNYDMIVDRVGRESSGNIYRLIEDGVKYLDGFKDKVDRFNRLEARRWKTVLTKAQSRGEINKELDLADLTDHLFMIIDAFRKRNYFTSTDVDNFNKVERIFNQFYMMIVAN